MINPVSSSPAPITAAYQQPAKAAQQAQAKTPEDTVTLSPQAKAAAGDADHDGDSH
jgi:hypothetical protein